MDIYARLGVKRRINAAGTLTRLGGSLMAPEVLEAMREASQASVDISELQALPDTSAFANEVLMIRTHRNAYDHAIRAAGARIIDIGNNDRGTGAGVRGIEPWEIEAAISPRTV